MGRRGTMQFANVLKRIVVLYSVYNINCRHHIPVCKNHFPGGVRALEFRAGVGHIIFLRAKIRILCAKIIFPAECVWVPTNVLRPLCVCAKIIFPAECVCPPPTVFRCNMLGWVLNSFDVIVGVSLYIMVGVMLV